MEDLQNMALAVITDYISCADYMCKVLKGNYPTNETLLRSRRINLIPKEGKLPDGIYFNFHGTGCYFEFENGSIDLDFGPNDRCDGFDQYRVYDFLEQSKKGAYKELHDKDAFKREFDMLVSVGEIVSPEWEPNSHLFYLKDRINFSPSAK